ncbi:hypothetical protein EDB89DRAFT_1325058 [Lactarius sanguifluus]|nr:hypothetical protein EDB89DRAFT_1325058 [Lactarius sanguifluus]
MGPHRPTTTINTLPDNVLTDIFSLCRIDELDHATVSHRPWKWHRLAHVCRTWRHIMFTSSRRLRLELLCTRGTPIKKNLRHLPLFPIVISFLDSNFESRDQDNLLAALVYRDRVRVIDINLPDSESLFEDLVTEMQEPFPVLTHLRFESDVNMPPLPDTFLGGSAPRLQTIYMSGIPFPAAPTLLSSACSLVKVDLKHIPPSGYIPPEVMVATLAALPRLKHLTFGFECGMSYTHRIRIPPTAQTVLPALTRFYFKGLVEYSEDLLAQIDAPQLDYLRIKYLYQRDFTDFQLPQLHKFFDRSEKFKVSRFIRADLHIDPFLISIELVRCRQSLFYLSVQQDAIGQVVSQIPAMHSNVDRLFISSDCEEIGDRVQWLELFRLFTSVRALSVDCELSWKIALTLKNITEGAVEVLPGLELLYLEDQSVESVQKFVAARQNAGRPVTFIDEERVFRERLKRLNIDD